MIMYCLSVPVAIMPAKNTGPFLQRLRALMQNKTYVPEVLHAYIVPTDDAHQVMTRLHTLDLAGTEINFVNMVQFFCPVS